jgi:hypothetical protein
MIERLTYVPDGAPVTGSFEDAPGPESGPIIRSGVERNPN